MLRIEAVIVPVIIPIKTGYIFSDIEKYKSNYNDSNSQNKPAIKWINIYLRQNTDQNRK